MAMKPIPLGGGECSNTEGIQEKVTEPSELSNLAQRPPRTPTRSQTGTGTSWSTQEKERTEDNEEEHLRKEVGAKLCEQLGTV